MMLIHVDTTQDFLPLSTHNENYLELIFFLIQHNKKAKTYLRETRAREFEQQGKKPHLSNNFPMASDVT